jgi:hypothetical protein
LKDLGSDLQKKTTTPIVVVSPSHQSAWTAESVLLCPDDSPSCGEAGGYSPSDVSVHDCRKDCQVEQAYSFGFFPVLQLFDDY